MEQKKWTKEEEESLKQLYFKNTTLEIANILGRSVWSVQNRIRKLGISGNKYCKWTEKEENKLKGLYYSTNIKNLETIFHRKAKNIQTKASTMGLFSNRYWSKEEDLVLIEQYPTVETKKLVKMLNRSRNGIIQRAGFLNISKAEECKFKHLKKYRCNDSYFNIIDSPDKAYFLGFLWADGNIHNSRHSIKLSLNIKDRVVLEKFKYYIEASNPIYTRLKNNCCTFTVFSKQMYIDLIDKGITPNKTYGTTIPNNIPNDMCSHFIRGLFDGDGGIYNRLRKNKYLDSKIDISNNESTINWLYDAVDINCGIKGTKDKRKGVHCWRWSIYSRLNIINFANYIYKDSKDLYLERKHNRFIEYGLLEK